MIKAIATMKMNLSWMSKFNNKEHLGMRGRWFIFNMKEQKETHTILMRMKACWESTHWKQSAGQECDHEWDDQESIDGDQEFIPTNLHGAASLCGSPCPT